MINFKQLSIPEVLILEPKFFADERGFFFESFNQKEFDEAIGRKVNFVQDNHSMSTRGVLRGLHYQLNPYSQGKLVRVISGEIFDVAVDIRPESKTYGLWIGEFLTSTNKKQLWIPEGFAHGFLVISETAEVLYKATNFYNKGSERSIIWNDEILNIKWPFTRDLIISKKDNEARSFKEGNCSE
jgi:dTDP-4-dehydrorhamnose 3,5-epimerase